MDINIKKNKKIKITLIILAVFFIFVFIVALSIEIFENKYLNKIYPGIYLNEINLGGKTTSDVEKILKEKISKIDQEGIKFKYNILNESEDVVITPTISSFSGDLAYKVISFNITETIDDVIKEGRKKSFLKNILDKAKLIIYKKNIIVKFEINEDEIKKILKENYKKFEIQAENANIKPILDSKNNKNISFELTEEKLGKILNYEKATSELKERLLALDNSPIILIAKSDYPKIYLKDCLNIEAKAEKIMLKAPITLSYEENTWNIEKEEIAEWLKIAKNEEEIIIDLDSEKIKNFLNKNISEKINKKPTNARFEIEKEKVIEFIASEDGVEIDIEKTLLKIKSFLFLEKNSQNEEIKIPIKIAKSTINVENINNFGVKEIIGTGYSNFSGSPANRIHNIKTGADSVNGLLIEPDKEFSLVEVLGEIEASTGYLQELVIKGNKTIPEYGGGLCQIGTTIFRAAIASGLPITARSNHSYRVSYYEPAGTDAAIYDPWPDVRFLNDTKKYILIQARIDGNNLYFDFWGEKDGRIIEKSDPVVYNIIKPGPTKIIETLDLPAGEKKCTERAHNGADAYFDYKVIYQNGEIKEERFLSHYIPWQEVCLLGIEKLPEENSKDDDNDKTKENNINNEENKIE